MASKRNATSPANKDSKKHKDEECIICCKPATDNIMECVWCESRLHAACAKLSEEQCILIGNASNNIVFFCTSCFQALPVAFQSYEGFSLVDARISVIEKSINELQTSAVQGLNTELKSLQKITSNLATKIKDLCTQNTTLQDQLQSASSTLSVPDSSANSIATLTSKINDLSSSNNVLATTVDKLTTDFSSVTSNLSAKHTNGSSTDITTSLLSVMNEEKEKDLRRLNLIIHNLVEPTQEDGLARKQADIQKVSKVIHDYLGVSTTVNNAIRLGKRGAKLRLLKISVDTPQNKAAILRRCTTLRSDKNPEDIKRIYITPDLTPKEREANSKLRSELAELNKNGREYMIKSGKIVRRSDVHKASATSNRSGDKVSSS